MNTAVRERPIRSGAQNGGIAARRAVIRWAWRLLRCEWRQQLLVLALIIVAVAATFVGAAVATNTPSPAGAGFGTAQDMAVFSAPDPHLATQIAALARRFGRVDVIENQPMTVPGSVQTYDLRAQNPHGPFGQPMLALVSGHYPVSAAQVAVTSGLASQLRLKVGGLWRVDGRERRVVGILANPQNLLDEFALVLPGQIADPAQVTVLFDAPGVKPGSIGPNVSTPQSVSSSNVINPQTISIAAATLGMLLVALVGAGGFTVLAQRRLRSIGMLGAQGATDRLIGLVVRANGVATGIVGALAGFAVGLLAWLAYRPRVESSAHHLIGVFQLPWLVIVLAMALAVLASYFAAARPAKVIARVPIVTALSGRPAEPGEVRRATGWVGVALLVIAFLLLGAAGAQVGAPGGGGGNMFPLVLGIVALAVAVVLLSPSLLTGLAWSARRTPVAVRLALRDLARYRARSGSALGAISLSMLIAAIVIVVSAARFGNVLDYAGPNLAPNQVIVYLPGFGPGGGPVYGPGAAPGGPGHRPGSPPGGTHGRGNTHRKLIKPKPSGPSGSLSAKALAPAAATARDIATALGARDAIALYQTSANLQHAAAGRQWHGPIYVGTRQLLAAFGIKPAQVSPTTDVLTMRPGLDAISEMELTYGDYNGGPPGFACPARTCLANPKIEEASTLPSGTDAPNTVITEHAVRALGLPITTVGWLIQAPSAPTASQVYHATQVAAAAGLTIERRNNIPSLAQIVSVASAFEILLALCIVAMSVGLVRSETASDLRILAATGAGSSTRRTLTAVTAGALALTGAVAGTAGGYLAAIGFLRTNHLDTLSALRSVPVASLLAILIGMPLVAVIGGWLLAGREPPGIARQPLE